MSTFAQQEWQTVLAWGRILCGQNRFWLAGGTLGVLASWWFVAAAWITSGSREWSVYDGCWGWLALHDGGWVHMPYSISKQAPAPVQGGWTMATCVWQAYY